MENLNVTKLIDNPRLQTLTWCSHVSQVELVAFPPPQVAETCLVIYRRTCLPGRLQPTVKTTALVSDYPQRRSSAEMGRVVFIDVLSQLLMPARK